MIRTQWFSILFFLNLIFLSVNAQEDAPKPSAIFKAVFWDRFTSKNLSYAPWGNYEDNNATMVSLQVGFSTVSRPFVYYGPPPVKFLRKHTKPRHQLTPRQAIMKKKNWEISHSKKQRDRHNTFFFYS